MQSVVYKQILNDYCNCDWCPDLLTSLNVAAEVDLVRQLGDVHLEPVLYLVEDLGVSLIADEGDGQTLGSEPASPRDSVQVCVGVLGHVVVETMLTRSISIPLPNKF